MCYTELSARVIVKDDVKGTSKKAIMAYFKKQSMAILDVTKKPSQILANVDDFTACCKKTTNICLKTCVKFEKYSL
jgi:hypothetical protein